MPKQKRPASSEIMIDKVTELILHDIQTGLLAPGAWLKQIDLEQRYRCGRPEVRRALDRLAQKRLVAHVPNRGYHVYRPDGWQEGEVAEIRIVLATGVAGRIVTAATVTDIALLERLAEEFVRLMIDGITQELYEANLEFHYHLIAVRQSGTGGADGGNTPAPRRCMSGLPEHGLNNPPASTMR